jgi:hypothetical protein
VICPAERPGLSVPDVLLTVAVNVPVPAIVPPDTLIADVELTSPPFMRVVPAVCA